MKATKTVIITNKPTMYKALSLAWWETHIMMDQSYI